MFLNLHIISLRQSLNFFRNFFFICRSFDEEFYHDEDSVYFIYNQTFCSNKHIHWFYPFLPFFSVLHILSFGFLWISWCKRKHRLSCEDVSSSASNERNGHTLLFLSRICPSLFSLCSIFCFYRCQHLTSLSSLMILSINLFHH